MKVAEVISDMNIGGAGRVLLARLKYSDKNKINTTVIVPEGSELKPKLLSLGINVIEINGCKDRSLDILAIPRYAKLLRSLRPELINCHGSLTCRIAARICRVPISVYTRHCTYPLPKWQKNMLVKKLLGTAQSILSDWIIAVADAAKKDLVQMGTDAKKIRVIINGCEGLKKTSANAQKELRQSLCIPDDAVVVGICARIESCKGHTDFIKAARALHNISEKYRFLIIGKGSKEKELRKMSQRLGLDKYIIFTGFLDDVSPYYGIMDINVNCSVGTETSSLAISEGMSVELPTVASDYGGNPYMVRDGVNGFIYPCGRYDILAQRINTLATDKELYAQMSKKAYDRFCNELNAQHMTKETEAFYFECYRQSVRS